MANMSYCRFRNTLSDLEDCADYLSDRGIHQLEDEDEQRAAKRLIQLCKRIAEENEEDEE